MSRIGVGAAGLVFKALDRMTGEHVALKVLRGVDADSRLRAKAEFRALRDIVHPNVARLYELAEGDDGSVFFTMELIRGVDFLSARGARARAGFADGGAALRDAIGQLAEGLGAIHAEGKLHRDVKPSNVMVNEDGIVVLLDFGGVRDIGKVRSHAAEITVSGTPAYMAPEQYDGSHSPACDWFSVGVVLYEALTGHLPFDHSGAPLYGRRSVAHPSSFVPEAPRDLGDLALALLLPDPSARAGEREVKAVCPAPLAWMRREREAPFVGRTTELADLAAAFHALAERRPVLASVEGRSGYGKTALIERFLAGVARDPAVLVLRSRCHPQESVRYEAFDGLVDELVRHLCEEPASAPADLTPEGAAALRHVFPVLERVPWIEEAADLPPGVDPADVRRAAFAALRTILACVAAERPTVLWIDDLQWGKADSIPLLREMLLAENAPAALFLVSFRMDEGEGSAIVEALESARIELDRPSTAIELGPLPPRDAIALAASVLDESPEGPQPLAARVNAEADGSPIFLTLLARALARRADAPGADEEWTLARVVAERVAGLPGEAVGLLETLSLLDGPLRRSAVYDAARLDPQPHRLAAALQQERWIRLVPGTSEPALAMAHDRVAQIVRAAMTTEKERDRHQSILAALEKAGIGPEVKLRHAEGAGELRLAAELAHEAGDRAATRLAFVQAARFFRRALELHDWNALTRRVIREKLAGSLVNAGLCGEAAPVYELAAAGAPREQGFELRRLAAEQFMVSGRHDEGLRVLEPLLADLELRLPRSPQRALVATAARLARLAARGTRRFATRGAGELSRHELTRIDVCFSAARGLIMSDTVRAGFLPLVGLELALRAGEPRRVGRHLAIVAGAVLTPFGGPLARWRDRMLAQCDEIAARTGDAYVHAAAALSRGQIGIMTGSWSESLAQSEAALAILRDEGRGVNWEKNVAHASELRALEELGRLREANDRARELAAESRDLGDHYGAVVASLMRGITLLAAARPDEARRQLAAAFAGWPDVPFLIQHFYRLRIEVMADLYEGEARSARGRLMEEWGRIEHSQFLRVAATRIDALALRARTALAVAAEGKADEKAHLALARSDAKRLAREARLDARGHAHLILSCAASIAGDEAGRLRELAEGRRAFAAAEMPLWEKLCDASETPDLGDARAWRAVCAPGL